MEEADIIENAFQIIFAFDEIVALGYRESVNLAQIRTFVEMDSHEEKVYQVSKYFTYIDHLYNRSLILRKNPCSNYNYIDLNSGCKTNTRA